MRRETQLGRGFESHVPDCGFATRWFFQKQKIVRKRTRALINVALARTVSLITSSKPLVTYRGRFITDRFCELCRNESWNRDCFVAGQPHDFVIQQSRQFDRRQR
jgi:hypothetical protein